MLDRTNNETLVRSTSGSNASTITAEMSTTPQVPVMVNVSYTLWVGTNVNETYNLTITAPKNETFYSVMVLAAEMSPHFQFVASEWPNGHYVHTLAGYKEEPMSYHYWLLYRLPSRPDPSSPPGNQLVAPGGNFKNHLQSHFNLHTKKKCKKLAMLLKNQKCNKISYRCGFPFPFILIQVMNF